MVKIIADSASDLPQEFTQEFDIAVVPLVVYQDNKEYLDNVTLAPAELFREMRNGKAFKTSQPPFGLFQQTFTRHAESGESGIYIAFSSGLSGTYQSGVLAKQAVLEEHPSLDLDIVDSKCASVGYGLVVRKAAQMAKQGKSKEEILEAVQFRAQHMEHIFTVDDLEYLFRGGRVSRMAAFIGGILNIKPILHMDDGKLVPIEKIRGRKKVLARMIEIMRERGVDLDSQTIGICHGDDLGGAEELKEMIAAAFGCKDFFINMIGATIGAHAGPGTLSVFFLNEREPQ